MKLKEIMPKDPNDVFFHEEKNTRPGEPRIIKRGVRVPKDATHLDYHNTIVMGNFSCYKCKQIISLVGAPIKVGKSANFSDTGITSIEGVPREVGEHLLLYGTRITNLHDIHRQLIHVIGISVPATIESHVLGLIKIRGLRSVYKSTSKKKPLDMALDIMNKYLAAPMKERDIHACQIEMMEAGLEAFAQL